MVRLSTQAVQITSFLLLVSLAVALGNLIHNLNALPQGGGSPGAPLPGLPAVDQGPIAVALNAVIILLGSIIITAIAIAVINHIKRRRKQPRIKGLREVASNNNAFFLGMVMAFGLFALLFVLRRGSNVLPRGGTNGTAGGLTNPNLPTTTGGVAATVPLGVIILLAVLGVLLGLNLVRHRRAPAPSAAAASRQEAATEIAKAVRALENGDDPRSAILRCYRDVCNVLGRHGVPDTDHFTPREFWAKASPLLRLRDASLGRLTGLFEVARYSHHALGSGERDDALGCLRDIRGELGE